MAKKINEQKLVDMMFEITIVSAQRMAGKSNEEIATWVAHQLRQNGFETTPCGMSWGVVIARPAEE